MNTKTLLIIAVGVTMLVVGTYFFTSYGPYLIAIEKGNIIPFKIDVNKPFDIQMGGMHAITTAAVLSSGYNMSHDFNIYSINYPFQISFNNGKLLVSARIKDEDGNIVATISKNNWAVDKNPTKAYDRNYNSYALEVITPNQIPILQVVLTPENRIFVGGVFYSSSTVIIAMLNDTTIVGSLNKTDTINAINNYNQLIFRYSSDNHLGELSANSPYAFGSQISFAPNEIINFGYILFGLGSFILAVVGLNQKSRKLSLHFYLTDEKRGYNSGKKLETNECELIFKRWNKLEKRVHSLLEKQVSDRTNLETRLISDYELFWMREAMKREQETAISQSFANGFKKAILEKCSNYS